MIVVSSCDVESRRKSEHPDLLRYLVGISLKQNLIFHDTTPLKISQLSIFTSWTEKKTNKKKQKKTAEAIFFI